MLRLRWLLMLLCLPLPLAEATAGAPRLLIEGRRAVLLDGPGNRALAFLSFRGGPVLEDTADPTCPATSSLQLAAVPDQGAAGFQYGPQLELPCDRWHAAAGGYVYRDPAGRVGGVRRIRYGPKRLTIRAGGARYQPPPAPMAIAQLRFTVGASEHLARFYQPWSNREGFVAFRAPSRAAARGERAFWETLFGDDRTREAQRLLSRATRRRPGDGRAHFLAGMLRLYRAGRATQSWLDPTPEGVKHLQAAHRSFERALPLLWDADLERGDSRVPGFAAVPVHLLGLVRGDASMQAEGLARLDAAVRVNPLFNNFNLFALADVAAPDSPLFARVLDLALDVLGPGASCVVDQPEMCANDGLASHNLEGALVMLGDIYAKGGLEDEAHLAYTLAGLGADGSWPFAGVQDERLGTVSERIDAYRDADPANDPPIFGSEQEACAICHARSGPRQ